MQVAREQRKKPVPDVLAPGLDAVFVGINPGFVSARAGHHFANPANGFWRLMHESGLTRRRLSPAEERELLRDGVGLTNLVDRATAGVAQLTSEDFARGSARLARKLLRYRPRVVVFVGLSAYRAFERWCNAARTKAKALPPLFVVPNPSGRNAHFSYAEMLAEFRRVARALGR